MKGVYDPDWPPYKSASADPGECNLDPEACGGGGGGGNDKEAAAAAAAAAAFAANNGEEVNKEWRLCEFPDPLTATWSGGLGVVKLLPLDGGVCPHKFCNWSATASKKEG